MVNSGTQPHCDCDISDRVSSALHAHCQARKQAAKEAKQKGELDPARVALLGGFLPLVRSDRVGRIKPRGQILKIIAQIYTEVSKPAVASAKHRVQSISHTNLNKHPLVVNTQFAADFHAYTSSFYPAWGRRVKCLCVARATLRVDSAFEHSGASFLTYLTRGPLCATCAAVSSAVDDRERNPRVSLPVFVYDWHLNRYGLRNLAEMNLMDMIASTRHWAGSSLKVKLFGQFCGVVRSDHSTLEHLNFYLYCMQVLSANVALLFPELEDAVFWLKPLRVLDVVRAVFPAFGDAATLRQFMASKVRQCAGSVPGLLKRPGCMKFLDGLKDFLIPLVQSVPTRFTSGGFQTHLHSLTSAGSMLNQVEPLMDNRTKMYDADKLATPHWWSLEVEMKLLSKERQVHNI
eukprot:1195503-Prorocentrum_minimum.AAC.4